MDKPLVNLINNNIIELVYPEHITIESQTDLLNKGLSILSEQIGIDNIFKILVDTFKLVEFDEEARCLTKRAFSSVKVAKMALIGTPNTLKLIQDPLSAVDQTKCNVRVFDNRDEAINWLNEK